MQSLAQSSALLIADMLESKGWSRSPQDDPVFYVHEGREIVFQVALNVTARDFGAVFFPALGVRHVETGRLVHQFKGYERGGGGLAATFGCSLLDLARQAGCDFSPYDRWLIREPLEIPAFANRLCGDIETLGWPFFRSLETLDRIIDRLWSEKRYEALSRNLAVAAALAGKRGQAVEALREIADGAADSPSPAAEESRSFVLSAASYFDLDVSAFSGLRQS